MRFRSTSATIAATVALLLVTTLLLAGAVPARTPFHANPAHVRAPRLCNACHVGHSAMGADMLKVRVRESVCGGCHSAADIARWRLEDLKAGIPSGPPTSFPLSTFGPGAISGGAKPFPAK